MDLSRMRKQARDYVEKRALDLACAVYHQILIVDPKSLEDRKALRAVEKRMYETKKPSGMWQLAALGAIIKLAITKPAKDPSKVLIAAEEALVKNPFHIQTLQALGNAAFYAGDLDTANWALEDALSYERENKKLLWDVVNVNRKERPQRALDYLERILKIDEHDSMAHDLRKDLMANVAMDEGKWEDQNSDFKTKVKGGIEQASADGQDIELIKDEEDARRVVAMIDQKLAGDQKNTKLLIKKAGVFMQVNLLAEALAVYQQVLAIDKANNVAKFAIGDIHIKEFDQQLLKLKGEMKTNPNDAGLKGRHNEILKQKVTFGIKEYRERVQSRPTDMALRFQLGVYLFQAGMIDDAIKEFQQAVNDPQRRGKATTYLAECFIKKDLPDFAIAQLQKAQKMMPVYNRDAMDIDYRLAKLYEQKGEKAQARELVSKIAEKDFNFRDVQNWLKKI